MTTSSSLKYLPDAVDVLVLGGGLAGHCAALAAAEVGASVALLEKLPEPGGSTLYSAGSFALAGTDLQKAVGVEDTPEGLAQELQKIAGGHADPALIRCYIDGQLGTYEWLKQQGVVFHKVSLSANTALPRTHPTDPRQLIEALHQRVKANDRIRYLSGVAARSLTTAADGRSVTGVSVVDADQVDDANAATRPINVRGGVVLATGGFTRNRELVRRFAPELADAPAWGGEGNTGDGLTMAWALGADLVDMGFVTGTFGVAINHYPDTTVHPGDDLLLRMAMYRGGIAVNVNGERFADESLSYKKLATVCLAQPRALAFQIFDQPVMDQSAPYPTVNDLKGLLARGIIRQADTLPELAAKVGLDGAQLQATVDRYNRLVTEGADTDFGRATLGGGFGKPVTLTQGPFYALPCSAALLSTYCGLHVDAEMRVKHVQGPVLPGLYAAGEIIGGFHGAGYMSGSSLGKAAIFGRIAGRNAAQAI